MPIINGTTLGVSYFDGFSGYPSPRAYTGLKIFGGAIYFDHVHVKNRSTTLAELEAMKVYDVPPWTIDTILLANFRNTPNCGNVTGLASPVENWVVQRRDANSDKFITLDVLTSEKTSFIDTKVESDKSYVYQVLAINATEVSEPLVNTLESSFFNCVLMNLDGSVYYLFDMALDFSGYASEIATQRFDGYNQYSSYYFGERNFKTGDVTALMSNTCTDNGIDQSIDFIKGFDSFINNKEPKIFKDRKGNAIKVVTNGGVKQAPLDIKIGQQPYLISFHFEEVGDLNG